MTHSDDSAGNPARPADAESPSQTDVLSALAATIAARRAAPADASYTRKLLDAGAEKCARKFAEEAIELVIAATCQSKEQVSAEAADVLYHMLVVLESRGVAWQDVVSTLQTRSGTSGLAEKAARLNAPPNA
jgi:phosphoribosyl-ATP pyrophosphohydrolase